METNESYYVVRESLLLALETGTCRLPKMPIIGLPMYLQSQIIFDAFSITQSRYTRGNFFSPLACAGDIRRSRRELWPEAIY